MSENVTVTIDPMAAYQEAAELNAFYANRNKLLANKLLEIGAMAQNLQSQLAEAQTELLTLRAELEALRAPSDVSDSGRPN